MVVLCAWEICEILLGLLSPGHNKWYQSFQVSLGISGDSESSRSDSVEIVCRSQIRGIGVRRDRVLISGGRKEGSWNLWWSRSGEKLYLGFQGTGKNPIFICVGIYF